MPTISTQTDESIGALFRFRDVAEDTCSGEAVTDALMKESEEWENKYKNALCDARRVQRIIDQYQSAEEDYSDTHESLLSRCSPENLRGVLERMANERQEAEEARDDWEEQLDNLQLDYDADMETAGQEARKRRKEIEMLKWNHNDAEKRAARILEYWTGEVATLKRQLRSEVSPLAYWGGEAMKLERPPPQTKM